MNKKKRGKKIKKTLLLENSIEYLALLKKQNKGTISKNESHLLYELTKKIEHSKKTKLKPELERKRKVIQSDEEEYIQNLIKKDLIKRQTVVKKEPLKTSASSTNPLICQSCGSPLKEVYGVQRCKCN